MTVYEIYGRKWGFGSELLEIVEVSEKYALKRAAHYVEWYKVSINIFKTIDVIEVKKVTVISVNL